MSVKCTCINADDNHDPNCPAAGLCPPIEFEAEKIMDMMQRITQRIIKKQQGEYANDPTVQRMLLAAAENCAAGKCKPDKGMIHAAGCPNESLPEGYWPIMRGEFDDPNLEDYMAEEEEENGK